RGRPRPGPGRAVGRPHPRYRPHHLRRCALQRTRTHAAAPAGGEPGLRARSLGAGGTGRRPPRRGRRAGSRARRSRPRSARAALDWLDEREEPAAAAPRVPAPKQPLPESDPAVGEDAPATPGPSPDPRPEGEPPAVADWLASEPAGEPEYESDVQPALPVTPP